MMNGNGGYEYGASYSNLGSQLDGRTATQQSPKGAATYGSSPAGGPSSSAYDPTLVTLQNAAQHQLLVASVAATYAQAHHHQQQQQQQQHLRHQATAAAAQQHQNNLAILAAGSQSPAAAMAAAANAAENFASSVQQQQNNNTNNFDPLPMAHGQAAAAAATVTRPRHERQCSFDALLMLHPSLISGLPSSLDPFPMQVPSSTTNPVPAPAVTSVISSRPSSKHDYLLEEIKLEVPSVSLEPLSGNQVVERLSEKMDDVLTKYIPCVDFLVQCQQDLRKGLDFASQRSRSSYGRRGTNNMSPRQFFQVYVDQLPQNFFLKNQYQMESKALNEAFQGLQKLRQDAKRSERQGCEAVKSNFLGGMKDGESWGLRKWLSKHGNALHVCTDLECILHACQKLDRDAESTKRLGEILRPLAERALNRLREGIPSSYQQHSTAHPYLPFFHRLESALRGVSNFDPEDDDVICIDSDDDDDVEVVEDVKSAPAVVPKAAPPPKKRKREAAFEIVDADEEPVVRMKEQLRMIYEEAAGKPAAATANNFPDDDSSSGESEAESVVEIVDVKPSEFLKNSNDDWTCSTCGMVNAASSTSCLACGEESLRDLANIPGLDDLIGGRSKAGTPASFGSSFRWGGESNDELTVQQEAPPRSEPLWPLPLGESKELLATAHIIAERLDKLATFFEQNQQTSVRPSSVRCGSFWEGDRYARVLRLFGEILRRPHSLYFIEPVDEDRLIEAGNQPFSHVIKHPLCFRDIAVAILGDELQVSRGNDGRLPVKDVSWNMWKGSEFCQAIDLVFLNSLAYGKALEQGRSQHRSQTNKIRKDLWKGIHEIVGEEVMRNVDLRKRFTPTRRSESSGFVVFKISQS